MRAVRRGVALVVLLALVGGSVIAWQTRPPAPTPLRPVDPRSGGPSAVMKDPGNFGWLLFVLLSWPATTGERGVPNYNLQIGAPGATVWETYKSTAEVYLPNGARPAPWNVPFAGSQPPEVGQSLAGLGGVDSPWLHYLSESVMIDGRQIVDATGQIVQYDVRMNRAAFGYVVNNQSGYELFNLEGQRAALADASFTFRFPTNAIEVKAAWRILEPGQDDSRYWTSYGIYTDSHGNVRVSKIGLTAIHIISKVLPDWLWLTFEQLDNPTATFQYFEANRGGAVGPNQTLNPAAAPYNARYQSLLAGTKWQYYALMGWQYQFENPTGTPTLLANTQAETYFQGSSSCITCHSLTSIGPPSTPRLSFWNTAGGNVQGFTGKVDFQALAKQQYPSATFKPMDYAWSFRNARPKKTEVQQR
jgi:hypothetical protein